MIKSNIIAGSNVIPSEMESPFWDPDYVQEVQDYALIKYINERSLIDNRFAPLTKKQHQILQEEIRCIYAESDPCWGYDDKSHRMICKCIKGSCRYIRKCNKNYNSLDAAAWRVNREEIRKYGDPEKMPEYYYVDLITDEESKLYLQNPQNGGIKYLVPPTRIIPDITYHEKKPETRIDSKTGKLMVVTGHRWITNRLDPSYADEILVPIWEEADKVNIEISAVQRKAKRIEKAHKISKPKKKCLEEAPGRYVDFDQVTERLLQRIDSNIDVIDNNVVSGLSYAAIIVDNPAEKAFVSSMFLKCNIDHNYDYESPLQIICLNECNEKNLDLKKNIVLSQSIIDAGCKEETLPYWKYLTQKDMFYSFQPSYRIYNRIIHHGFRDRWYCANSYGATHLCIFDDDIISINDLDDGIYDIVLQLKDDQYYIYDEFGQEFAAVDIMLNDDIAKLINSRIILAEPVRIDGLALQVSNQKYTVLGMGHLVFDYY